MEECMKKILFHIIILAFCLPPKIALGDDGKCIEGDCANGKGIYLYSDGSKYTGEFADGVRNGQGTLKIVGGIKYVGQWANDLPNGQGVKTLEDGMQYSGEFKNGVMHGIGTLIMPDGSKLKIKWDSALPSQENWHLTTIPGKTPMLSGQETQQSAEHMEAPSEDLSAGEAPPSQEPDQSAVPPERVVPQAAEVDAPSVQDMVQPEETGESQPLAEEDIKSETAAPVGRQDSPTPKEIVPQNIKTENTAEYASITAGANIRSQASLTSDVLHTVPPGYPVIVLEKKPDWFRVEDYHGRKGWVYASLLTSPETVIIKVFKGNLRSGPSLKDSIMAKLDHGTIMTVLERKGDWLKVSDSKKLTGWLHRKVVWPATEMDE